MNTKCTVYQTVDLIGKRWSLLILLELYKGKDHSRRYTDLKNSLMDITPKILSQRLRELEQSGVITKKVKAVSFPVRCEYKLTPTGLDLINVVKDLKKWALKWSVKNKACENQDCSQCVL